MTPTHRYYSQTLFPLLTPWTSAPPQITHSQSASLHSQPRPRRRRRRFLHRQHHSPPPSHHSNKPSATRLNPSTTSLLMAVLAILVGVGCGKFKEGKDKKVCHSLMARKKVDLRRWKQISNNHRPEHLYSSHSLFLILSTRPSLLFTRHFLLVFTKIACIMAKPVVETVARVRYRPLSITMLARYHKH